MPKVIVCGRGGSGKSTLVSLLAMELGLRNPVLVLDADESNLSLGAMLGLEPPPMTIIEHLGGKPAVFEKMRVMFDSDFKEEARFFEGDFGIEGLLPERASGKGPLFFARIGKIEHSMEGCACPMGAVARSFLKHMSLQEGQWVLVDTEAGVEHFGRGLLEGADAVLIVVDPSYEAVTLAGKAAGLAREAGKPFLVVLNKVDGETEPQLREMLAGKGLEVLTAVPYSTYVTRANLSGEPLSAERAWMSLGPILPTR
jgi:CO dehydrogenase maturation factor